MIKTPDVVVEVQTYVEDLFKRFQNSNLQYHNLGHTQSVVRHSYEIFDACSINEQELPELITAAWFHDTGQLFGAPLNHEERSVAIMKDYFEKQQHFSENIYSVANCIIATKIPQNPHTLLQKIICDADTYNLGTEDFIRTDARLKKEMELRNQEPVNDWDRHALKLLIDHEFFTPYCRQLLNKGKQRNIDLLIKKIQGD